MLRKNDKKSIRFVMRQEKTLKPCANFIITESPSCDLSNMANNEKAYMWVCQDFTDIDKPEGVLDKLACRFQTKELADTFKKEFEAAQTFNVDAKAGKPDAELVFAEAIEDIEEVVEDDIDTNRTADADGDE